MMVKKDAGLDRGGFSFGTQGIDSRSVVVTCTLCTTSLHAAEVPLPPARSLTKKPTDPARPCLWGH